MGWKVSRHAINHTTDEMNSGASSERHIQRPLLKRPVVALTSLNLNLGAIEIRSSLWSLLTFPSSLQPTVWSSKSASIDVERFGFNENGKLQWERINAKINWKQILSHPLLFLPISPFFTTLIICSFPVVSKLLDVLIDCSLIKGVPWLQRGWKQTIISSCTLIALIKNSPRESALLISNLNQAIDDSRYKCVSDTINQLIDPSSIWRNTILLTLIQSESWYHNPNSKSY